MLHLSGGLFSGVVDRIEGGLRSLLNNEEAELVGTRRENDLPWMSLVGRVANEVTVPIEGARPPAATIRVLPDERLPLGAACTASVHRPGYLYAYPNDALGFYGNNAGSVRLTVTRTGPAVDPGRSEVDGGPRAPGHPVPGRVTPRRRPRRRRRRAARSPAR